MMVKLKIFGCRMDVGHGEDKKACFAEMLDTLCAVQKLALQR
jgi:hypothetical protein